jgi:hypothetical protein
MLHRQAQTNNGELFASEYKGPGAPPVRSFFKIFGRGWRSGWVGIIPCINRYFNTKGKMIILQILKLDDVTYTIA